jgi:hypothetical protein
MAKKKPARKPQAAPHTLTAADIDLGLLKRAVASLPILTPGRLPVMMDALQAAFQAQCASYSDSIKAAMRLGEARGLKPHWPPLSELPETPTPILERSGPMATMSPAHLQNHIDLCNLQYRAAEIGLLSLVDRHAYYATEEMAALISAGAAHGVENLALTVADLPSTNGIAYLHRPGGAGMFLWWSVVSGDRVAATLTSVAQFKKWFGFEEEIDVVTYPLLFSFADLTPVGTDDAPRGAQMHNPYSGTLNGDEDPFIQEATINALPMLFSFVHMLRQEMTQEAVEQAPPSPVTDRKGRRKFRTDRVTYLSVRRGRTTSTSAGGTGREYSVRWVVRGHWRRQWYPSQNRHIPIWIMDYIAGPEDAPLVVHDKVTVVAPSKRG